MTLLSRFLKVTSDTTRDTYLNHLRGRNRAITDARAARIAGNTQGIHNGEQRARAATCATLSIELKHGGFEYLPTAQEARDENIQI